MATNAVDSPGTPLAELAQTDVLHSALETAFAGARRARVAVALRCGEQVASAVLDERDDESPARTPQPIGCIAKLVTATLARMAVSRACFAFDDHVTELLGARARSLRGVTARHLIEHTHGCDDSLLDGPRQHCGGIDGDDLLARVERLPRLACPGAIYSYGNLGAWLVATILERVGGRRYAALARDEILAPLDVACADGPLCAATGGGLTLTAEELTRFVAYAARMDDGAWPTDVATGTRSAITPLPGWNPLERGVHLGWKSSGCGWFGHQSAWPRASAYVRAHPQRRLALAVLSRDQSAAVVAARLFGARIPELFDLRPPSRAVGLVSDDALRSPARYEHAAHVVNVEPSAAGVCLTARAHDRLGTRGEALVATLRHAAGGVHFAEPSNELFPYAQLVDSPDGGAALLWNGRFILRRTK